MIQAVVLTMWVVKLRWFNRHLLATILRFPVLCAHESSGSNSKGLLCEVRKWNLKTRRQDGVQLVLRSTEVLTSTYIKSFHHLHNCSISSFLWCSWRCLIMEYLAVPRHTFIQIPAPDLCLYTNGDLKRSAFFRTQAKIDCSKRRSIGWKCQWQRW